MVRSDDTKPDVKLAICIPSQGEWKADFGMSFAQMCVHLCTNLFEPDQNRNCVVVDKRTSLLARSRQECLEDAVLQECTHALFLDADQSFPPDTAHRLMAWKKPVVAANIALKTMPSFPTARQRGPMPQGVPVVTSTATVGLERVWRVGTGIMLIDMAVVVAIPKPWFEVRWSDKHSQYVGEDWYFLKKIEDAGFEIYVDHDLSKMVGHVGDFAYRHEHVPAVELALEKAA